MDPPAVEAPAVELDGDLPASQRFTALPKSLVDRGRALLDAMAGRFPPSYPHLARLVSLRTLGRFEGEARGLATRLGTDWHRVLVANLAYDLVVGSLGCSTVALATASGPVLARNMDWAPEALLAQASVRIDVRREGRIVTRTANWPGGIGVVTGLSARGFAVALNAVFHPGGPDRLGYPVLLFLRTLLDEAKDFADALERLRTRRLMTSGLFTLVGRSNDERVVVERSPRDAALRRPAGDAPLVTTNHYQALAVERGSLAFGLSGTSADRCSSLRHLVEVGDRGTEIDDAQLLRALAHPDVVQSITAQHVVARPAGGTMRVYVPNRFRTT